MHRSIERRQDQIQTLRVLRLHLPSVTLLKQLRQALVLEALSHVDNRSVTYLVTVGGNSPWGSGWRASGCVRA